MASMDVPASAVVDGAIPAPAAAAAVASTTVAAGNSAAPAAASVSAHEAHRFLLQHKEKLTMNQYWYSLPTIAAMVQESQRECSAAPKRACFLSTPSIFFSLTDKQLQARSKVFDYDEMWASHPGFVKYDYKRVDEIPKELYHSFDFIVIDPPFITAEVWAEYAKAAKLLLVEGTETVDVPVAVADSYYSSMQRAYTAGLASLRGEVVGTSFAGNIASMLSNVLGGSSSANAASAAAASPNAASLPAPVAPRPSSTGDDALRSVVVPRGKLLLSTIPEHEGYLYVLLGCHQPRFRPSIPNLIYQYSFYVNYPSAPLTQLNPEIDEEEPVKAFTSKKKSSIPL